MQDHHFKVKLRGELNGDSLDVLKRCLDPKWIMNAQFGAKNRESKPRKI